jgi:hypothetical protein
MKNEIVLFETEDHEISLPVETDGETVWLTRNQMAQLFNRDVKTIGKHINNAFNEECSDAVIARFATTAADGKVLSSGTLFISVPPSDDGTLQPERAIIITAASCAEHARFI